MITTLGQMVDLRALAMLVAANSTPVIVARLVGRFAAPIDAHLVLKDGRPLFGSHKTWRGLVAGVVAGAIVGAWLGAGLAIGAAFGALSLAGDLCSSFVKRRLRHASGESLPLLDQLPEALLPLVAFGASLGLDAVTIAGTAFAFTALDLVFTRIRLPPLGKSAQ
jgi:CDP-2,3-bis-(O-geranylgeranyl)-sn-glycerol synthase